MSCQEIVAFQRDFVCRHLEALAVCPSKATAPAIIDYLCDPSIFKALNTDWSLRIDRLLALLDEDLVAVSLTTEYQMRLATFEFLVTRSDLPCATTAQPITDFFAAFKEQNESDNSLDASDIGQEPEDKAITPNKPNEVKLAKVRSVFNLPSFRKAIKEDDREKVIDMLLSNSPPGKPVAAETLFVDWHDGLRHRYSGQEPLCMPF